MVDIEWPCPECDQPFASDTEMELHRKTCKGKDGTVLPKALRVESKVPNKNVVAQPQTFPITLKYQYEGRCFGGHNLETITVDLKQKNKITVVAYCPSCKKQFSERTVAKL